MKYHAALLFTVLVLCLELLCYCSTKDTRPADNNTLPKKEQLVDWPLSIDHKAIINSATDTIITVVDDIVFETTKTYRAYPLKPALQQLISQLPDTTDLQVVFSCVDGYQPTMPLSKLLANDAFLAVKDMDIDSEMAWPADIKDKFAPAYLVWPQVPADDQSFVWPYGLFKVSLDKFTNVFSIAVPDDPAAMEGFQLFKLHCMKCHSINRVGGNLGPEFNHPKNITDYWKKEDIRQFVQAPQSYRYNSKMPAVAYLTEVEFEQIYRYLIAIKAKKIQR